MKILFTDDQEYDDENSSENIIIGLYTSHKGILVKSKGKDFIDAIENYGVKYIVILDKDALSLDDEPLQVYPKSQIKRIIP